MAKEKVEQKLNIIFVGKREKLNPETGKMELVSMDAPTEFNSANVNFKLPVGIENGAYLEEEKANILILTFPDLFKQFVEKGAKQ